MKKEFSWLLDQIGITTPWSKYVITGLLKITLSLIGLTFVIFIGIALI